MALSIKVRDWGLGWPGLSIKDKSEELGARLARALSIKTRGWGPGWPGPGRPGTVRHGPDTVRPGVADRSEGSG